VLKHFREKYPKVAASLPGNSEQIAELASTDHIDLSPSQPARARSAGLVRLPAIDGVAPSSCHTDIRW
jgi:hypothetical protein